MDQKWNYFQYPIKKRHVIKDDVTYFLAGYFGEIRVKKHQKKDRKKGNEKRCKKFLAKIRCHGLDKIKEEETFFFFFFLLTLLFLLVWIPAMKNIGLLLFFSSFVVGCFAVRPELVDKKMWFVNDTILNVDYEMAVLEMEFDQDLYLSGETFLCGRAEQDCPVTSCTPCDWSSQQVFFNPHTFPFFFPSFFNFFLFLFKLKLFFKAVRVR